MWLAESFACGGEKSAAMTFPGSLLRRPDNPSTPLFQGPSRTDVFRDFAIKMSQKLAAEQAFAKGGEKRASMAASPPFFAPPDWDTVRA
jgi:hypothetical protein